MRRPHTWSMSSVAGFSRHCTRVFSQKPTHRIAQAGVSGVAARGTGPLQHGARADNCPNGIVCTCPFWVAQPHRAQRHSLYRPAQPAGVDVFADPKGILHQEENARDHIAHHALRAKADSDADNAEPGKERTDIETQRGQRDDDGHDREPDQEGDAAGACNIRTIASATSSTWAGCSLVDPLPNIGNTGVRCNMAKSGVRNASPGPNMTAGRTNLAEGDPSRTAASPSPRLRM
jgi:hypothetical protein